MLRTMLAMIGVWFSVSALAATESSISLLDNRFRIDPTVEQVTFVIYRAKPSEPVVLVRPDGTKYFAWDKPDKVQWYQEPSMDIIMIDHPMPGPWQAIGKVTPKNNIKLFSHLELSTDKLPQRLYHGEKIKFTAQLTSDNKPLVLRDFLDRLELKVTFTKYVQNESELSEEARPIPEVIGEFADDGKELDEYPGDGIFTVTLPIKPQPGKYKVRITSGNGVFLRAREQEVLVYPEPFHVTFIQAREEGVDHQVIVSGEEGAIRPGSIAAHINRLDPGDKEVMVEGYAKKGSMKLELNLPNTGDLGNYTWFGRVFATEVGTNRPLIFDLNNRTYSVLEDIDIEETRRIQEEKELQQQKLMEELRLLQMREEARTRSMMLIGIGNVVAIILGFVIWFVWKKFKASRQVPEMKLDIPEE
ncbi:TIGR03503 family protein [Vibrio sp. S4M6]|uniref:TIGR03503 family protein n=1 Tax=Vibrio sinus TaxID=2946865 RepID=UPI002029F9DB|nr:TIGR03503 family protein [Vibrio sinus]MCL9782146.1 TIGR03503 family protein [Vibrio sinus]